MDEKIYTQEELGEHLYNQAEQNIAMVEHLNGRIAVLEGEKERLEESITISIDVREAFLKEKDEEIEQLKGLLFEAIGERDSWFHKFEEEKRGDDNLKQKVEELELKKKKDWAYQASVIDYQQALIEKIQAAARPVYNQHRLVHPNCDKDDCLIHVLMQACTEEKKPPLCLYCGGLKMSIKCPGCTKKSGEPCPNCGDDKWVWVNELDHDFSYRRLVPCKTCKDGAADG